MQQNLALLGVLCNSTINSQNLNTENLECNKKKQNTTSTIQLFLQGIIVLPHIWSRNVILSLWKDLCVCLSSYLFIYQSFICEQFRIYIIISMSIYVYSAYIYSILSYLSPSLFITSRLLIEKKVILIFPNS